MIINIRTMIDRAYFDRELRAVAIKRMVLDLQNSLADEHLEKRLGASDAGDCIRKLWLRERGKEDIPESLDDRLRMDQGTFSGAWLASLAAVGIEKETPYRVVLEAAFDSLGLRCHVDLAVLGSAGESPCLFLAECKNPNVQNIKPPSQTDRLYWLKQSGIYTHELKPDNFAILIHAPAAVDRSKNGEPPTPRVQQFNYTSADWTDVAQREASRLLTAKTLPTMPDPDFPSDERWRCKSCRFSSCNFNQNPLRSEVAPI
jgi:hypothetical protein